MQRITRYALLAIVALVAPIGGQAQAPKQAQAPRATVRELATIDGNVTGWVRLPSGRALIYTSIAEDANPPNPRIDDSTFTYDIATKQRTLLGMNMRAGSVSPPGDRLAFIRSSQDGTEYFVWTMPIDPQTGRATGQAQRVSLRPVVADASLDFSPDGKMLSFSTGPRPDGTWDVAVVPATGGAERVVANYPRPRYVAWAADGQSLYVEYGNRTAIERVPVAGGRSEPLIPYSTNDNDGNIVGVLPDARGAVILNYPDRFFYRTAAGVEREISVALPPLDGGWGSHFSLDSRLRLTMMTQVRNQGVRVLDLTTGQARELVSGTVQTSTPAWSPDGRRLAVLTGSRSHYDITVVNVDGSSPRRYPMQMHVEGSGFGGGGISFGAWEKPWSPDGRFLAFRANRAIDRDKVGYSPDDQDQLAVLELASGQTRVLTTSPVGIASFVWRLDGKGLRAIKHTRAGPGGPWRIVEVTVEGTERPLRDISAELPRANNVVFASDRTVVVRAATDQSPEFFLVPLDGGTARRLADADPEPGLRTGGFLVAGDRLLLGQVDPKGGAGALKILSFVGDSTRTIRPPIQGHHGVPHPDGKQIINVGKATGDSDSLWKFFLIPLDGSPTRLVGEIPRGTGGILAPSPDGRLLAYTSDGRVTSKILEIDFAPALQAIMKR